MSTDLSEICVILVGYNSADTLDPRIKELSDGGAQVVLVDNASEDSTIERFVEICPRGIVISNSHNLGFARAVNIGATRATGELIFLLNPDARVEPEHLASLNRELSKDETVAVVGPATNTSRNAGPTVQAGHRPDAWRMFLHSSGAYRLSSRWCLFEGHYLLSTGATEARDVDWVCGAAMLIRRSAWVSVGGLSSRWFMYGEDIDLCLRLRAAGFRIVYTPGVLVDHEIGGSSAGIDGRLKTEWLTNLFEVYQINIARSMTAARMWKLIVAFGYLSRGLYFTIRPGLSPDGGNYHARRFFAYARSLASAPVRVDLVRNDQRCCGDQGSS